MWNLRPVHIFTYLMHTTSNIWPCEAKIVESTNNASIQLRIFKDTSLKFKKIIWYGHRDGTWFNFIQLGFTQKDINVLFLFENNIFVILYSFHSKKKWWVTQVFDKKMKRKSMNKSSNNTIIWTSNDNVININQDK